MQTTLKSRDPSAKVLIVDDEEDWRENLREPLLAYTSDIFSETDKFRSMALLAENRFDLVILNVRLKYSFAGSDTSKAILLLWTELLHEAATNHETTHTLVVTSESQEPEVFLEDIADVAYGKYRVDKIFVKERFQAEQYRNVLAEIFDSPKELPSTPSDSISATIERFPASQQVSSLAVQMASSAAWKNTGASGRESLLRAVNLSEEFIAGLGPNALGVDAEVALDLVLRALLDSGLLSDPESLARFITSLIKASQNISPERADRSPGKKTLAEPKPASTTSTSAEIPGNSWWRSASIDWTKEEPKRALKILSEGWPDKEDIVHLARKAGISQAEIDTAGPPNRVWRRVIALAARSGLLARLLQEAIEEPTHAAYRSSLEKLLVGELGTEVAAVRLEKGKADGSTLIQLGATFESLGEDGEPLQSLEAIGQPNLGLGDPLAYAAAIIDAMRRTAMIEVGGRPRATGFLVGEQHLLTAAHVVGATTEPPVPGQEIRAVFDFYTGTLASHAEHGRRVGGSVVAYSLPTPSEARGRASWDAQATHLDYALIELDAPVANQPGGPEALLGLAGKPRSHFRPSTLSYDFSAAVFLLATEHPLGEHQKYGRALPPFEVNDAETRVRYGINTLVGSSGSPVFDDRGRLVALHQLTTKRINQGIPISAIARDLSVRFPELITDD